MVALIGEIERLLVVLIGTAAIVLGAAYGAYHGLCGRFHPSDPPTSTEVQPGGPARASVPEVHETPATTQLHHGAGGVCTSVRTAAKAVPAGLAKLAGAPDPDAMTEPESHTERRAAPKAAARRLTADRIAAGEITPAQAQFEAAPITYVDMMGDLRRYADRHRLRIVSGGQTGADRAALDVALELGLACGGWCPNGRLAEDGTIPNWYPLRETASAEYPPRTRANVEEADATIIFDAPGGRPSRGTALTVRCCKAAGKPHLVLNDFPDVQADVAKLSAFLAQVQPTTLNVAGNRESGTPGIYQHVRQVLVACLSEKP